MRRAALSWAAVFLCGVTGAVQAAALDGTGARVRPPEAAPAVAALWRDLASGLSPTVNTSRRLLLGSRDPNGPTCVDPKWGNLYVSCATGGPGTRLSSLLERSRSERTDLKSEYTWQQTTLRSALDGLLEHNQEILPQAVRLAEAAEKLSQLLAGQASWPPDLQAQLTAPVVTWPEYCANRVSAAMAQRDLEQAREWAEELSSALFTLADLHRWLDYLCRNELAALDFQARCETLFTSPDPASQAAFDSADQSRLPAGRVVARGVHNYQEVEHQAEWLMRLPREYVGIRMDGTWAAYRSGLAEVPAAVWMPPNLRPVFIELRRRLTPANQRVWDEAAHEPFDRSYLANMLFRISTAGATGDLGVVLERFNRSKPAAPRPALMGAIFYRGGDPAGANLWADRFEPRLMETSAVLIGTNEQVLLGAQRFTRTVFGGWDHYRPTRTLHEALTSRQMDCITATDMIGSLFRNAGRAGFYNVRWCGTTNGHSVAAAETERPDGTAIVLVDGLKDPQSTVETWPDAYVKGAQWPEGMVGATPDIYAVELYARGLDNYVWAEGYIIRGPNAGLLVTTPVPYLPNRVKSAAVKISGGDHSLATGQARR